MAAMRFNPDGTPDTSFSADGKTRIDFSNGSESGWDFASSVAVDSSDRIVIGGATSFSDGDNDFAVARLSADGNLDPSFSGDGQATVDFGGYEDTSSVAL